MVLSKPPSQIGLFSKEVLSNFYGAKPFRNMGLRLVCYRGLVTWQ